MRPEAEIEQYFKKKAEEHDVFQCKFSSGITGVPDRIIIKGVTAFVELKAINGHLSSRQEFVIRTMRKHGAIVYVPKSKEEIDTLFENL